VLDLALSTFGAGRTCTHGSRAETGRTSNLEGTAHPLNAADREQYTFILRLIISPTAERVPGHNETRRLLALPKWAVGEHPSRFALCRLRSRNPLRPPVGKICPARQSMGTRVDNSLDVRS